ncbi:hypothetical protein CXG81DRAFT_20386 [Caulochytrium protostelioides]|uniref:Uncharacterized protein n=1 Tax=Caulochytrium protostelioides TaxID=1555241 RepID=A0A4P9X3D0_9FUNG|nr:hypothetical protein CXG81DRAFT_20386 [Caulochytrium protostelioides]|eukprot:RKO99529.1 hypothetical protein CXG81DRAFT_20386 [Caulochytrium protostelioides]
MSATVGSAARSVVILPSIWVKRLAVSRCTNCISVDACENYAVRAYLTPTGVAYSNTYIAIMVFFLIALLIWSHELWMGLYHARRNAVAIYADRGAGHARICVSVTPPLAAAAAAAAKRGTRLSIAVFTGAAARPRPRQPGPGAPFQHTPAADISDRRPISFIHLRPPGRGGGPRGPRAPLGGSPLARGGTQYSTAAAAVPDARSTRAAADRDHRPQDASQASFPGAGHGGRSRGPPSQASSEATLAPAPDGGALDAMMPPPEAAMMARPDVPRRPPASAWTPAGGPVSSAGRCPAESAGSS